MCLFILFIFCFIALLSSRTARTESRRKVNDDLKYVFPVQELLARGTVDDLSPEGFKKLPKKVTYVIRQHNYNRPLTESQGGAFGIRYYLKPSTTPGDRL